VPPPERERALHQQDGFQVFQTTREEWFDQEPMRLVDPLGNLQIESAGKMLCDRAQIGVMHRCNAVRFLGDRGDPSLTVREVALVEEFQQQRIKRLAGECTLGDLVQRRGAGTDFDFDSVYVVFIRRECLWPPKDFLDAELRLGRNSRLWVVARDDVERFLHRPHANRIGQRLYVGSVLRCFYTADAHLDDLLISERLTPESLEGCLDGIPVQEWASAHGVLAVAEVSSSLRIHRKGYIEPRKAHSSDQEMAMRPLPWRLQCSWVTSS
jgi:hypothetical protein